MWKKTKEGGAQRGEAERVEERERNNYNFGRTKNDFISIVSTEWFGFGQSKVKQSETFYLFYGIFLRVTIL